jgi:hypothetical protein
MFINELAEPQLLVIYPGRFQPFHRGHYAVYEWLTGRFGRNNVYISTSNKVEGDRSPFSFAEKLYFMQLTGVPADRVIQATQPYQIENLISSGLQVSEPDRTVVIFAVSEKDMAEDPRFSFKTKKDGSQPYFQPLKDIKDTVSMKEHAYIMTVPTFQFNVAGDPMQSATELRAEYRVADAAKRQLIVQDLFGRYTHEAEQIMSKIGQAAPELNENLPAKNLNQLYQIKHQLFDPKTAEPQQPEDLQVLKQRRDRLFKLEQIKKNIEKLQQQALTRTGGELPPGLAADLEDYYTLDDVDSHFPDMLANYEKQLAALDAFLNRRKKVFKPVSALRTGIQIKEVDTAYVPAGIVDKQDLGYIKMIAHRYKQNPSMVSAKEKEILQKYLRDLQTRMVKEDAAGVGVVRGGKDLRYMTATMGDQNDVNSKTLGKMMRAYNLVGVKAPQTRQEPVSKRIGTGVKETREPYQQAIDRLELAEIEKINDEIDRILKRFATEKLPDSYKEKLKAEVERLKNVRLNMLLGKSG